MWDPFSYSDRCCQRPNTFLFSSLGEICPCTIASTGTLHPLYPLPVHLILIGQTQNWTLVFVENFISFSPAFHPITVILNVASVFWDVSILPSFVSSAELGQSSLCSLIKVLKSTNLEPQTLPSEWQSADDGHMWHLTLPLGLLKDYRDSESTPTSCFSILPCNNDILDSWTSLR